MKTMEDCILQGAYDIHIHATPDVVPRAIDLKELSVAADNAGMAGIVLKDHCTSTVGRASALNAMKSGAGCRFFSSLALNPPVGGLNPTAVESALRAGASIIYFPTYGAANHLAIWGAGKPPTAFPLPQKGFRGVCVIDQNHNLNPRIHEIIDLIAGHNAVLATGHVSPQEALQILREAKASGVERMIMTHASESVTTATVDQQKQAISMGAVIEHCFFAVTGSCPGAIDLEQIAGQIRATGVDHVILSSDFGQPANGDPVRLFAHYLDRMVSLGFTEDEIRTMVVRNPARLLEKR